MPEETVSFYHSLKTAQDADNETHYLVVVSIIQLFSSKEEKQVEKYHGFYGSVSTQICSVTQNHYRYKKSAC